MSAGDGHQNIIDARQYLIGPAAQHDRRQHARDATDPSRWESNA